MTYFHVSSIPYEDLTVKIVNSTPFEVIVTCTSHGGEPEQRVASGSDLHYAQKYPSSSSSLVRVVFEEEGVEVFSVDVDLLIITTAPKHYDLDSKRGVMRVSNRFLGVHKVIEFGLVTPREIAAAAKQGALLDLRFGVAAVGVSLIYLRRKEPRIELAHIFLSNVYGMMEVRDGSSITCAGFVDHMQVDNNAHPNTSYPVVLRRCADGIRKSIQTKKFLEWSVSFEDPSKSNHLYLSNVLVFLGDLEVLLEEEYLDLVKSYLEGLSGRLNENQKEQAEAGFLQRRYFEQAGTEGEVVWQRAKTDLLNNYIYIDNLSLPHIKVLVSYFQDASATIEKEFELVSLIGVAVGGFDNAMVEMKGLHRE